MMPSKKIECQTCGGMKDPRAFQCKACQMKYNHPRKGTGAETHRVGLGYVGVMIDNGGIFQHRAVMEKRLGRKLETTESVHHINGDRADNRLENLELMSRREHHQMHTKDRARDGLGRFM